MKAQNYIADAPSKIGCKKKGLPRYIFLRKKNIYF